MLAVIVFLSIPHVEEFFVSLALIGPKAAAQAAQVAHAAHYTPNALERWKLYLFSWMIQALTVVILFMFPFRPVRNLVTEKVLKILRETNGQFQPIPYIVQSLVSRAQSLLSEIRRSS